MSLSDVITDMEAILDDGFFSEPVVHNYPTAQTENLVGMWDDEPSGGPNDGFSSNVPSIILKTSALGNIAALSEIVRGGITYKIIGREKQEHGLTRLYLSATS